MYTGSSTIPVAVSSQSLSVIVYPVQPTIELSFQDGTTKTIALGTARGLVASLEEAIKDFERAQQINKE